jgi:hypothetical protein
MWYLWWTKWHWDRFSPPPPPEYFRFPLSISFHQCSITRKRTKNNHHLNHKVAHEVLQLQRVCSICCGALLHNCGDWKNNTGTVWGLLSYCVHCTRFRWHILYVMYTFYNLFMCYTVSQFRMFYSCNSEFVLGLVLWIICLS